MLIMEDFELIRRMVLIEGFSQRDVALKLNRSRKSIRKALLNSEPANYALGKLIRDDEVVGQYGSWIAPIQWSEQRVVRASNEPFLAHLDFFIHDFPVLASVAKRYSGDWE